MIDESQIEYLLNGERAEADVLNRPLKQLVRATNASLAGVGGVTTEILDISLEEIREEINTVVDNSTQLIEEIYDEIFEVTRDGNGFTREKDAQLIFDADNATVSIAPGLGKSTWFYYHKGRKIESSETLTYTLSETDKTDGGFYLSLGKDGNFVNTGPYPDFYKTTLCFYVHYSNGEFIIEGDERHTADRDTAWHSAHHREDGMVVYTLGSIDWTADDADNVGIQITSTLVADEDLQHLIKHSPTGEEPFSQILEGSKDTVRIPTLYYDGSIRYLADKKLPWVVNALKYNDGTTIKDVPNGKFVNYFLVATHCQKYPIKLIMGRKLFDSDHETVDETLESLGLNFPEIALLYRISIERDNSLSTVGKCKLKSVQQAASRITFESAAGAAGSGLSNHAQLLGRNEDNAHSISAITGLRDELDTKVDKVSGKELSTNDFTDALKNKLDSLSSGAGGVIPISGGGTGATSAPAARTALGLGDEAIRWPTWTEVTNKPAEYDPTAHTHPWDQVTGKPTTFTASAHTHTWAELSGKPALPAVVQTTGSSTTNVMSQRAVTDALSNSGGGTPDVNNILFKGTPKTAWQADHLSVSTNYSYSAPEVYESYSTFVYPGGISCKSPSTGRDRTFYSSVGIGQGNSATNVMEITKVGNTRGCHFKGTINVDEGLYAVHSLGTASHVHAKDGFRVIPTIGGATVANITATGAAIFASVTQTSDDRYKDKKEIIGSPLYKLSKISGYTYDLYNDKDKTEFVKRSVGVIAQDVEKVLPDCVEETDDKLSVSYSGVTALLVESVKELMQKVESLEKEIKILKQGN